MLIASALCTPGRSNPRQFCVSLCIVALISSIWNSALFAPLIRSSNANASCIFPFSAR